MYDFAAWYRRWVDIFSYGLLHEAVVLKASLNLHTAAMGMLTTSAHSSLATSTRIECLLSSDVGTRVQV